MLVKAGVVIGTAAAAGLLAVSPFAFAHDGHDGECHQRNSARDGH